MKLEEFEALEKAATPGPWKALPPGYRGDTVSGYMDVCAVVQLEPDELDDKYSIQDLEENDASFIAACREMVPKLIKIAKLAQQNRILEHREFDHSDGCPACDAYRFQTNALAELEQA